MVLGSHSSCLLSPRAKLEEKRKKEEEKRIREEEKRLREEEKVAWLPALPLLDTVAPECFLSVSLLGRWALWELCAHSDPTLPPSAAISMSTMGRRLMGWGFESLQAQYCLPRVPWDNCCPVPTTAH